MSGRAGTALRRLAGVLPHGTLPVAAGLAVLGAASYIHLAAAGHTLDNARMSSVSALWAIVFSLGPGLFLPVEQEITRIVARRRVHGEPAGPVLVRGATLATGMFVALATILVIASPVLADKLFDGDRSLVWALIAATFGLAISHTTRGVLSGSGHFSWYGIQLGLDGALRIVLAVTLALLHVHSALWFGLVLVLAPIGAVLATSQPVLRALGPGLPVPWRVMMRGLGLLVVATLLSQILVNIGVINVKLLAPGNAAVASALLSALVLARVPLFVFASMQASLLPGLSTAVTRGDLAGYRRLTVRGLALVTGLSVLGGAVAIPLGPWLIRLLFDAPDVLDAGDFALLTAGTMAFLWTMVLGQAVLAAGRHVAQATSWVIGMAVLIAVTLMPGGVIFRVELAYLAGALSVAIALLLVVVRRPLTHPSQPAPAPVLEETLAGSHSDKLHGTETLAGSHSDKLHGTGTLAGSHSDKLHGTGAFE